MRMRRRFGKNDAVFLGILVFVCVMVYAGFRLMNHTTGSSILVTRNGKTLMTCSLMEDQKIPIENSHGKVTNVLEIKNGKAKMVEADCPDGLCLHQKAISLKNENIVCLPNRVVVTVMGDDGGFDGFAQ